MFTFKCPYCDSSIEAVDDYIGTSSNCPACSELIIVPDQMMEPETEFEGFTIKNIICSNPLLTTYLAIGVTKFPNKTVVLRIPSRFTQKQGDVYHKFDELVKETGSLSIKGFPELIDSGTEGTSAYYAFDSQKGIISLRDFNKNGRNINPYRALRIIRKLASSLMHLWDEHKAVVQSLQPESIYCHINGDYEILDIGLSQFVFANQGLLNSGLSIWDSAYTAPELLEAEATNTPAADIFSLGRILMFLLSGTDPDIEGVDANCPNIPADISTLLNKMTDSDQSLRYSDHKMLLREIDEVLKEVDLGGSTKASYHEESTMSFETNDLQEYLDSTGSGIDLSSSDDEQVPTKKKKSVLPVIIILFILLVIGGAAAYFFFMK